MMVELEMLPAQAPLEAIEGSAASANSLQHDSPCANDLMNLICNPHPSSSLPDQQTCKRAPFMLSRMHVSKRGGGCVCACAWLCIRHGAGCADRDMMMGLKMPAARTVDMDMAVPPLLIGHDISEYSHNTSGAQKRQRPSSAILKTSSSRHFQSIWKWGLAYLLLMHVSKVDTRGGGGGGGVYSIPGMEPPVQERELMMGMKMLPAWAVVERMAVLPQPAHYEMHL